MPDVEILNQSGKTRAFIEGLKEAFHQGTRGALQEASLYTGSWGFELKDITGEVSLWYGELDENVPLAVGQNMAGSIPNSQEYFFEKEGHLSIAVNHIEEILKSLLEQ